MNAKPAVKAFLSMLLTIMVCTALVGSAAAAALKQDETPESGSPQIEVISPYYSEELITTPDGTQRLPAASSTVPPQPLPEYQAEREASMTAIEPEGTLGNMPSYDWVFGCSAVSGAMIAGYYDRTTYPNMYADLPTAA